MFRIPPESCSLATAKRKGTRLRGSVTRMPHGACEDGRERPGRLRCGDWRCWISPGIRWGLWRVCLTANRRFSTVKLKRADFTTRDDLADGDFGRAMWPADTMKAKVPFWLPLPPVARDVAAGSIADYTELVKNENGDWPSSWVFASTRRHGRDPDNDEVSVFPNSLNRHLLRMRDDGILGGLPYFSLHLARTVMGNFLETAVSPVASSLVLAHTLPQTADEAAPTTRAYYLTSQRMAEKAAAMAAWSEALVEARGTMPVPSEGPRLSKIKSRAIAEETKAL